MFVTPCLNTERQDNKRRCGGFFKGEESCIKRGKGSQMEQQIHENNRKACCLGGEGH